MYSYGLSCALLLAVLATPAWSAGLTESEALRLGLSRPEISELQQARRGEAEADLLEAGTWSNPTLELNQDRTGTAAERTWQLNQAVDISGRRGLRETAARHRIRATEAENRARQNQRSAELRLVFHELLRQQEQTRAVSAWTERFGHIDTVVAKLAKAGEVSGYDRRRLAREQRSAEAKLAEFRAGEERSRARLAALIGRSPEEGIAGKLLPESPQALPALQTQLMARPEFAALSALVDAAQNERAAAQRNLPELTVGVGRKQLVDGPQRDHGNLLMLSFSLPLFDRQQAKNRRAAAQAQAAQAELSLTRQHAEGELLGLHRQATQLIAAATRYRAEAVAPSAELVHIAESAYRAGESTVLELLDAYKGALEAELTALDLEWKARAARIELDQLTGNHPQ
ncbi:MAG: TolC family protein [Betaproteobacteria bacterium]|nr:TolC family protein [Betaproteobacteria bacterium]